MRQRINIYLLTMTLVKRFFCGLLFLSIFTVQSAWTADFHFKSFPELDNLPSKDVQSVYQDCDGYIWVATRNGLFCFDGYNVVTYKSNVFHPSLLTDNNVYCMAEDHSHRLWIGTSSGLNMLDKRTGSIRKYGTDLLNSGGVSTLLVTSVGRILIGTERGLYEYREEDDDFTSLDYDATGGKLGVSGIKSLMEDDRGDVWIGTWSSGLVRQEYKTGRFIGYPRMNPNNSAHVLFQDSAGRIWVGTWGAGLQLLNHPYEPERTTWTTFSNNSEDKSSLSDNLVYALSEDVQTHTLWVGTRCGLSVLSLQQELTADVPFSHCYADESEDAIAGSEVASLTCDRQGLMWVGMIGGGVNIVNTRKPLFECNLLTEVKHCLHNTTVKRLMLDTDNNLWMGIGSAGFGILSLPAGKFTHFTDIPEFAVYPWISTSVSCLQMSPSTGNIWIGIYNAGLFEYIPDAPVGHRVKYYAGTGGEAWICGSCIYDVYEDSSDRTWVATRTGISMRTIDGCAVRLDSLEVDNTRLNEIIFLQIQEGEKGEIWAASERNGIFRIQGTGTDWRNYRVFRYSTRNGKLNHDHINCIFKDSCGRIWVGSGGSGLNLYDAIRDCFLPVHTWWNLPGDAVVSILQDRSGNLWLGSNVGLLRLSVADDATTATFRLYTTADGLQDNVFNSSSAFQASDGKLFFGGLRGYNSFYPEELEEESFTSRPELTELKIFGQPWSALPYETRKRITDLTPQFADHITLDYQQNNFTLEFSALEYTNPQRNLYAYRLEGFDKKWHYTDATNRFASYNNLQPGTYAFSMYSSNSNGLWNKTPRQLKVTILPPPWKTWWAYTLYTLLVAGSIGYFYRMARNRMRLQNALHLREMEKEKAEELNHAKLQFFTNITHELLTPLTILSASVDEMQQTAPTYKEQYQVMTNNINRLIRLLQQILEFRKAESGNLKLKVSLDDLARFIRRELDSFRPLMQQKNIRFALDYDGEPFVTWFDADKMDKILYNLLSNAAKYSRPDETVRVQLVTEGDGMLRLTVKDNGPGIPKEHQEDLFKRFYEGSYRKFNTIGTGIGLSLVHDLVALHHGTIEVESEEGHGTTFYIRLPMTETAYAPEERDASGQVVAAPVPVYEEPDEETILRKSASDPTASPDEERTALLLVEDNVELLELMTKLLNREYLIYTAVNGKIAIETLEQHEVGLIVSDVMMPEMDGIALCRYVKSHLEISHIPLILLTAKNQEEDRVEAYESGADAFITKPFSLSVLHARIGNLLRACQQKRKEFKNQLVFEAKELEYTSIDEEFLKQAVDCVNRYLDDPDFDLSRFLDEMHTTKSTCFRKLKSLTGLTFVSFLRNIRMKAACRIMEEKKRIRIAELAFAVGYNDPRYFSSSFKKEMGMHPSEYMEKFTQNGNLEE